MRSPKTRGVRAYPGQPHHKKSRLRRKYMTGEWTHWGVSYDIHLKEPEAWDAWILSGGMGVLNPYDIAGGGRHDFYALSVSRLPGPPARAREEAARLLAILAGAPGVARVEAGTVGDSWRSRSVWV